MELLTRSSHPADTQKCVLAKKLGLEVVMLTGDNRPTAGK
jgi:cation transport ATPase